MKITVHGAAGEVGRSCIEVQTKNARFILDAGVKLGEETQYPTKVDNLNKIDAAIVSHSHLDHCGALPYLQSKGLKCPIYMTPTTRDISKILLKDFFHVESLSHIPLYKKEDTFKAFDLFRTKEYNQGFEEKNAFIKFFDAGHVPGSSMIYIEADNQKLLYTGDIRLSDTRLVKGANIPVKDVDALIIETTYGNREHQERKKTEREFLNKIEEVINRGGRAFIPSFAVGRAQEILLLLHTQKWKVPVYLDGIGKDITNLTIEHGACKDKEALMQARAKTIFISSKKEREDAARGQGIFVTTSGMLTGGPIIDYLKAGHQDPKNAILLTGYVMEGTNGRLLLEEGMVFLDGRKTKVHAEYKQYDFSAHAGLEELRQIIKKVNPKKLILVHGSEEALANLEQIERKQGREVYVPTLDSEINI